jgi:hypothetical protein
MCKAEYQRTLLLVAFTSLLSGCDADAPTPPSLSETEYHQPTAPDSVVSNLFLAHNRRDFAAYTALIAPEFKFHFVSKDTFQAGALTWNQNQDAAGMAALFEAAVDIDLTAKPSTPIDTDPNVFPPGTREIHVRSVEMTVLQADRVFFVVTTDQDLYLRPGNAAAGEDPTHWFVSEWREIEPEHAPALENPTPASPATWGQMKYQYLTHPSAARP